MEQWLKLNIQITIREKFKLHEESSSINVIGSCSLVFTWKPSPFPVKDEDIMLQGRRTLIWQVRKNGTWNRPFYQWMRNHLLLLVVTECSVISPHRRLICGPNTIDVEITPIWKLLIKEVISIFSWCWLEKFGSSQIIKNVICQW